MQISTLSFPGFVSTICIIIQIQEDIKKAGWTKAGDKITTGWGWGKTSLLDLEVEKRREVRVQKEFIGKCEKEREEILAEIAADEEKLRNLK
jgi:hypothetical protein